MLSKLKNADQQTKCRSQLRKRFRIFSKMTRTGPVSPYERMDGDGKKKTKVSDAEDKENYGVNEVKDKKVKKRSWKRIRQAAFATCRYIGMGVAHMSPATVYSVPDYYIDPKTWNKSFSTINKRQQQTNNPHWTSNMMFSAGW